MSTRWGLKAAWRLVLVSVLVLPGVHGRGDTTQPASPLQEVLAARLENRARLKTWQGRAVITRDVSEYGAVTEKRTAVATFKLDNEAHKVKWTWWYTELLVRKEGRLVAQPEWLALRVDMTKLRTPETSVVYEPGMITGSGNQTVVEKTLAISPGGGVEKVNGLAEDFDPRWYLTNRGLDMDQYLETLVQVNLQPDSHLSVRREQQLVTVDVPGLQGGAAHFVLDLARGGNLTRYSNDAGGDETKTEWQYENVNGAWVPTRFHHVTVEQIDLRSVQRTCDVQFAQTQVNEPINPAEFTIEGLHVPAGTRVSDHRRGLVYRYGSGPSDASLDTAATQVAQTPQAGGRPADATMPRGIPDVGQDVGAGPESRGRVFWIAAIAVLGLILGLAVLLYRRHGQRRHAI